MGKLIPFNVPYVPGASKKYVLEVLESNHQQGDGPFTAKASKMVSDLVGGGHVLLTPSCTHALEMASMLMKIGPGDEVILPSYTFTSAATAVTKFGATPVFVDIKMDTKGIDVDQARAAITPKTKAISWVNYAGVAPDIDGLQSLAREFNLLLIEDNAHGLGGSYKGRPLGSFGDFATQSFHATKNIQCGEGGALIINNPRFVDRAEIIREKGTDRSRFFRGEVDKYQWIDQGSSYLLPETLAGVLLGQLENFNDIQDKRIQIWTNYQKYFQSKDNAYKMKFHKPLNGDRNVAHLFYLTLETLKDREEFKLFMIKNDVTVTSHYVPLHISTAGKKLGLSPFVMENSIQASDTILRFPVYLELDQDKVLDKIEQFFD